MCPDRIPCSTSTGGRVPPLFGIWLALLRLLSPTTSTAPAPSQPHPFRLPNARPGGAEADGTPRAGAEPFGLRPSFPLVHPHSQSKVKPPHGPLSPTRLGRQAVPPRLPAEPPGRTPVGRPAGAARG